MPFVFLAKKWNLIAKSGGYGLALIACLIIGWLKIQMGDLKNNQSEQKHIINDMRSVIALQDATIDAQTQSLDDFVAAQAALEMRLQKLSKSQREAQNKIRGFLDFFEKYDMERLLNDEAETALDLVNNNTADMFSMFECATREGLGGNADCLASDPAAPKPDHRQAQPDYHPQD